MPSIVDAWSLYKENTFFKGGPSNMAEVYHRTLPVLQRKSYVFKQGFHNVKNIFGIFWVLHFEGCTRKKDSSRGFSNYINDYGIYHYKYFPDSWLSLVIIFEEFINVIIKLFMLFGLRKGLGVIRVLIKLFCMCANQNDTPTKDGRTITI